MFTKVKLGRTILVAMIAVFSLPMIALIFKYAFYGGLLVGKMLRFL